MSREAKKNYYFDLLRKLLQANPAGLNVTDVSRTLNSAAKNLNFNRKTLLSYFSQLVGTREAYHETVGNTLIFKPNGKLLHGDKERFYKFDDTSYYLFKIDNPNLNEKFFLLQERQFTPTGEKIVGGVMVPEKTLLIFMAELETAISRRPKV
jgi:hypothetical protein